jgi:hypothetical protein
MEVIKGHIIHTKLGADKRTAKGVDESSLFGLSVAEAIYGITGAVATISGTVSKTGGLITVGTLALTGSKKLKGKQY